MEAARKATPVTKTIGLVAHDNRKKDLIEWLEYNIDIIKQHNIVCTGTTGKFVEQAIINKSTAQQAYNLKITRLKSGPLGGDQQLGAMIAEGKIDIMIFFWDPMEPQAHDVDVKALLRITVLYNIPTASNRATADFMISSPLFQFDYKPEIKDYSSYINRKLT
ncbi:MAG: methylglyoxal synthase [Bacteroidales bacterium]|nr:methylglyoxal synthase [Bacteroidales bacterium]